jgi:RNA polymerase sigma-70 factor (ECF subfamily)
MATKNYRSDTISAPSAKAALLDAIRGGDEAAFAEYYEHHVGLLVRYVENISGDFEDARDIVQETFIKLWEMRGDIERLDGFAFTSANRAALDRLRKNRSRSRYKNERLYLNEMEDLPADEHIISAETANLIEEAIRQMPPQRRKVFELSRNENLTYGEIAERMNLSIETIRTHVRLALKEIRNIVGSLLIFILPG